MTQIKTERKNNRKTAIIVALLLALIALMCFGGYTFSKYVTSGSGTGAAQVAKWGYTAKVDTTKLFGKEYKLATTKVSTVDGTGTINVQANSENERNLVAPGTKGSMTFTVGGQAEVRALLHTSLISTNDVVLTIKKTADTAYTEYRPVKWTLTKDGVEVTGAKNVTLAEVANIITRELTISKEYAPNEKLDSTTYELSWAWVFENDGETVLDLSIDQVDTILGQMAAGGEVDGYTPTGYEIDAAKSSTGFSFEFTIQVSQLAR